MAVMEPMARQLFPPILSDAERAELSALASPPQTCRSREILPLGGPITVRMHAVNLFIDALGQRSGGRGARSRTP